MSGHNLGCQSNKNIKRRGRSLLLHGPSRVPPLVHILGSTRVGKREACSHLMKALVVVTPRGVPHLGERAEEGRRGS